jgi:Histidine kinase-, DNA gyrase B-, and HSP90-like ATPase
MEGLLQRHQRRRQQSGSLQQTQSPTEGTRTANKPTPPVAHYEDSRHGLRVDRVHGCAGSGAGERDHRRRDEFGIGRWPFRLDQLAEDVLTETVHDPHRAVMDLVPTVELGDPALVRIAIRNLVQNAVQHGRVADEPALVTLQVGAGVVRVTDNGSGLIALDDAAEGQRFRSGSPEGTGLGLAIARWVAELHGGSLRLDRAANAGIEAILLLRDGPTR